MLAAYAEATVIPSLDVHHVSVWLLRGSAVDCFKSECRSEVSAFLLMSLLHIIATLCKASELRRGKEDLSENHQR